MNAKEVSRFSFDREGKKSFLHWKLSGSDIKGEKFLTAFENLNFEIFEEKKKRKTIGEPAPFGPISEVNSFEYKFNEILFKTV